jgi:hypothetical protein
MKKPDLEDQKLSIHHIFFVFLKVYPLVLILKTEIYILRDEGVDLLSSLKVDFSCGGRAIMT